MAGAASRVAAGAKRPVTEPMKTSAVGNNKSHASETKIGGKLGKPRPNEAKKNATLEVKPKESEVGKTKPNDKAGVTPVAKVSSL